MERTLEPEIMDDPALDEQRHIHALRGLARLNAISGSSKILWPSIYRLSQRIPDRPLRILDIATGAGDVPMGLWRHAKRHGVQLQIQGVDISQRAIHEARQRCKAASDQISFRLFDAMEEELETDFDVIVSSLFLHHLTNEQAESLMGRMAGAARHLVLINDLRRCRTGLFLAWAAGRLFTRSDVVHVDGPLSAKAAFTINEVRVMAEQQGMKTATIARRWPCRFLLEWQCRPNPSN